MTKEYITKNRAKQFVCGHCNEVCSEEPCEPSDCDWMAFIDKEPAADVVPMVHGEWQSYESSRYVGVDGKGNPKYRNIRIYYCSQCGHCSIIRTKGCPNCRAKMDKEEK